MAEHWEEARWVLKTLLLLFQNIDTDGIDLFYTSGSSTSLGQKSLKALWETMDATENLPMGNPNTDMVAVLKMMFADYLDQIDGKSSKPISPMKKIITSRRRRKEEGENKQAKEATLIVLTDGRWPGCKRSQFEKIFADFTGALRDRKRKKRSYSVEFVYFGNNPGPSISWNI